MEHADRALLQRAGAADEPIAVRAFHHDIEQAHQPRVAGVLEMAFVHEGDADALRRGLQHQGARIEIVDRQRLDGGVDARRVAPCGEIVGHLAMDQRGQAAQLLRAGDRVGALQQRPCADDIDRIAVEPLGIQRRIDLARQRDHRVEPLAQPRDAVAGGVDIEMQFRMRRAQLAQPREQPLRGEQRQDAEAQAQHVAMPHHLLDRIRQAVEHRRDLTEQPVAIRVQYHRLMAAFEQRAADEALEALHAAAERGGGQRQFGGGSLHRPQSGDLHERLDGAQRRQSAHRGPSSPQCRVNECRLCNRIECFRTCNIKLRRGKETGLSGILS